MPGRSDDDPGVGHLFGLDHRIDQPWVAATQPEHPPICLLHFGVRVGEQHRSFGISGRTASWPLGRCSLAASRPNSSPEWMHGIPGRKPSSATACDQCRGSLIWLAIRVLLTQIDMDATAAR